MLKLSRDQRGVAHLALILLVVLVVGGISFAGWRVSQQKNGTKNAETTATNDRAAEDACNKVFKDKDLCKFTGNYAIDKLSYKLTLNSSGDEGATTTIMLNDGKGNSQVTSQTDGQTTEFITLNNVSFMKDPADGQWWKFAANNSAAPKQENPVSDVKFNTMVDEAASTKVSYKKLGKEKCGNLTCFKYQMVLSDQSNDIYYVWFDDKDYRMQHSYTKDAQGTSDMVFEYTTVKISQPSPVKDFPASAGVDPAALQQQMNSYGSAE